MNNLKTPQFLGLAVSHAVRLRQRNHPSLMSASAAGRQSWRNPISLQLHVE
jgi:hypothetical protein